MSLWVDPDAQPKAHVAAGKGPSRDDFQKPLEQMNKAERKALKERELASLDALLESVNCGGGAALDVSAESYARAPDKSRAVDSSTPPQMLFDPATGAMKSGPDGAAPATANNDKKKRRGRKPVGKKEAPDAAAAPAAVAVVDVAAVLAARRKGASKKKPAAKSEAAAAAAAEASKKTGGSRGGKVSYASGGPRERGSKGKNDKESQGERGG